METTEYSLWQKKPQKVQLWSVGRFSLNTQMNMEGDGLTYCSLRGWHWFRWSNRDVTRAKFPENLLLPEREWTVSGQAANKFWIKGCKANTSRFFLLARGQIGRTFSGKGQTVSTLGFAGREVSTVGTATSHGRWAWLRSNNISFTGTKMWIPYKLHKSQTSNLLSFPFPTKSKNHS